MVRVLLRGRGVDVGGGVGGGGAGGGSWFVGGRGCEGGRAALCGLGGVDVEEGAVGNVVVGEEKGGAKVVALPCHVEGVGGDGQAEANRGVEGVEASGEGDGEAVSGVS